MRADRLSSRNSGQRRPVLLLPQTLLNWAHSLRPGGDVQRADIQTLEPFSCRLIRRWPRRRWWWRIGLRKFRIFHGHVRVDLRPFVGAVSFRAYNSNRKGNLQAAYIAIIFVRRFFRE